MSKTNRRFALTIAVFLFCPNAWPANSFDFDGHAKYRYFYSRYPDNSIYRLYTGDQAVDQNADIRLKSRWQQSAWSLQTDYQLIALRSDTLEFSQQSLAPTFPAETVPNDDRRFFDLTKIIDEKGNSVSLHRLDRLYLGYAAGNKVLRIGRQAVSWGNGLFYSAMDFFNPFDPSAIDKEYKTGDDMIYAQYLFHNANDLQLVRVVRRDNEHNIDSDVASTAVKYHGLAGNSEYDILLAKHYNDNIAGFGGNTALRGAVWYGDITFTDTDSDTFTGLVTGLSYSWVWGATNYSGIIEYFYNGFGIDNDDYSAASLSRYPELLQRLQRGELFTLGKHYLAASATIELTPLWLITPGIFHNLSDRSSLFQLLSQHDLAQNLQLLLAVNVPTGSTGTEYGGIEAGTDNLTLSSDYRFSLQLGWYF